MRLLLPKVTTLGPVLAVFFQNGTLNHEPVLLTNTMQTVEELCQGHVFGFMWFGFILANANGLGSLAATLRNCTGDGPGERAEGRKGCFMLPWSRIAEWEPTKGFTFLRDCPVHG